MLRPLSAVCLLAATAAVQAPRLVDSIEAPYAYISLDGPVVGAEPVGGGANEALGPVRQLLANPALDALFASRGRAAGERAATGSTRALTLVRGMLVRGAGDIELALTGIAGSAGQPLLVMRVRLQRDAAQRLTASLAEAQLAVSHRQVGDHATYRLRRDVAESAAEPAGDGPGDVVELALLGDDLVIGNDGSAMLEVLQRPTGGTSAAPARRVLSADPRFQALRQRLAVPNGSLLVYGDWDRLGRRLQAGLEGAPGQLLGGSGLGSARAVMMSIAPANADFSATLLLDFVPGAAAPATPAGEWPDRHRHEPGTAADGFRGIDGWLAAAEPVPARTLVREVPRAGLGGLVLSVDLAAVGARSPRTAHLLWDLREAFVHSGLDFERNVLDRLGGRGLVQLQFEPPRGDEPGAAGLAAAGTISPVYALRATSRKAALDLFRDLQRVVDARGLGRLVGSRDGRGRQKPDVLELRGTEHAFGAFATVVDDLLLVGPDLAAVLQAHDDVRRGAKSRGQRDPLVANAIQSIGGESVAGLFDLDLAPLFEQLATTLPGVDLSALPKRHIGYLDIDSADADNATVVRICVLSSR